MKPRCSFASAVAALLGLVGPLAAQTSNFRGLWVGEATLGAVNEVSIPLDEKNVPRAPDPKVPTPTSDAANLRLILHVDATGQVRLLKQVAILARKAGVQESESDMALVTDERLYGSFPPQPAKRISSVTFDFGDARATAAVDQIARAAAQGATSAATAGAAPASIISAARAAATPVISQADSTTRFAAFQQNSLDRTKVMAIANGNAVALTEAQTAAMALRNGSFQGDTRAIEMVAAVKAAADAALPANKAKAALQAAAAFADTDNAYERFLAGEAFGDMIAKAAEAAARAADSSPLHAIPSFLSGPGATTDAVSPNHGLVANAEIALLGTGLASYDRVHKITPINANTFRIPVTTVVGGPISGYAAASQVAPVTVNAPAHGLQTGARVTVRDSLPGYNGAFLVSVQDADHFALDVPYIPDSAGQGVWVGRSGEIVGYQGNTDGTAGILITAPGHGLNNGQKIEILGAGEPAYNGLKTVTRVDAEHFSIAQAFGSNPAVKGRWEVASPILGFAPPESVVTQITSPDHGLSEGDQITISGAGNEAYNGAQVISAVTADSFRIPVVFDSTDGNPAAKGAWSPVGVGSWRTMAGIRTAANGAPEVAAARTQAAQSAITRYDDTRAVDAVSQVMEAIISRAALEESSLSAQTSSLAAEAGRDALANDVLRFSKPAESPSTDYTGFVRSAVFTSSLDAVSAAAAAGALAEKANLLATPSSILDKALQASITALAPVYSAASRSLLTSLPMTGDFGPGGSGLGAEVVLPANHPTNPFRHRRHPDHTTGFDIRRVVRLTFDASDPRATSRAGYGVDRITGTYDEEIFGLHKPLGPDRDTGLKVRGTFQLNRVSLIDTLNGR